MVMLIYQTVDHGKARSFVLILMFVLNALGLEFVLNMTKMLSSRRGILRVKLSVEVKRNPFAEAHFLMHLTLNERSKNCLIVFDCFF